MSRSEPGNEQWLVLHEAVEAVLTSCRENQSTLSTSATTSHRRFIAFSTTVTAARTMKSLLSDHITAILLEHRRQALVLVAQTLILTLNGS